MPERNWKKRMWRRVIVRALIIAVLLGLIATAVWGFILPYRDAESAMPTGENMVLQHLSDGKLELSWPAAQKTDYYLVEVLHPVQVENKKGELETQMQAIWSAEVSEGTSCVLGDVPWDEELTIRVNTMVRYENPDEIRVRPGENPLESVLTLAPPVIEAVQWKADPATDSAAIGFTMIPGDEARLWYHWGDENWQLLKTLDSGETTVTFGQNCDLPMIEHGQECFFRLDSLRKQPGSIFYSRISESFSLIREDLLDRDLWVQMTDEGDNVCSFIWNETKGESYELQMKEHSGDDWVTIHTVEQTGNRTYTTDHLKAFRDYSFRVVAKGGQAPLGKTAAVSDELHFETEEALLYSTIWPIKELKVYSAPDMAESIGTVAGGTTLCVVEIHENCFGIRYSEGVMGYIDSNYVMIDLVDYLGELCAYNITNSYSSIYMINKYDIPDITDKVITGYENVRQKDGTYLAPLLYPVAQRLSVAAQSAREAGYRLKIYDSYRPQRATVMLYNTTEKLLEDPVPGKIPDPTEEDPERLLTYGTVMTDDGEYPLNYFLARGASLHNLGIAVDLTIEKWDTRQEQGMQTKMHDLSFHSMRYRNNKAANLLKEFMEGAGFGGLVSEWWHYQDNEVRDNLKLNALWSGVSPEGWKLSDGGWRYRKADGTYTTGSVTIDDIMYIFDDQGYLMEQHIPEPTT